MVLSEAHYTKSRGCDGGDVLGLILRASAGTSCEKVTSVLCEKHSQRGRDFLSVL